MLLENADAELRTTLDLMSYEYANNTNMSSNGTIDGITQMQLTMMTIIYWYNTIAVMVGFLVNIYAAVLLLCRSQRYQFLPHLTGIIYGNLLFLSVLAYFTFAQQTHVHMTYFGCRTLVYFMAVSQHIATLCLTAIAVERYSKLYSERHKFIKIQSSHGRSPWQRNQIIIVTSLLALSAIVHLWVIPMATLTHGSCIIDYGDEETQYIVRPLMLLSVCTVYFIPFIASLVVNGCLIRRMYTDAHFPSHNLRRNTIINSFSCKLNTAPRINVLPVRNLPSNSRNNSTSFYYEKLSQCINPFKKPDTKRMSLPVHFSNTIKPPRKATPPVTPIEHHIQQIAQQTLLERIPGKALNSPCAIKTEKIEFPNHQLQNTFSGTELKPYVQTWTKLRRHLTNNRSSEEKCQNCDSMDGENKSASRVVQSRSMIPMHQTDSPQISVVPPSIKSPKINAVLTQTEQPLNHDIGQKNLSDSSTLSSNASLPITTIESSGRKPDSAKFNSIPLSIVEDRVSVVHTSDILNKRMIRNRRRTYFLVVIVIFIEMFLILPNHILNIAERYNPSLLTPGVSLWLHPCSYILWHLKFIISGLCVNIPFFLRKPGAGARHTFKRQNAIEDARHSIGRSERLNLVCRNLDEHRPQTSVAIDRDFSVAL